MGKFNIEQEIKTIVHNTGGQIGKLENKSILISGGAGFIGNYFLLVFYQYLYKFHP